MFSWLKMLDAINIKKYLYKAVILLSTFMSLTFKTSCCDVFPKTAIMNPFGLFLCVTI